MPYNNFYITKTEKVLDNLSEINSYYFVENKNKTISVFWFGYYNKYDNDFEKKYVNHILKDEIPERIFESTTIDSIDFAGRKIKLGDNCYWANVNSVQCPYNGQMNWSVHKTLATAKSSIENQFNVTKSKKGGKVISEE